MSSQNKLLIFLIFFLFLGIGVQFFQKYFISHPIEIISEDDSFNLDSRQQTKNDFTQVRIHIAGAVKQPGVYDVSSNLRVLDVIQLAGGVEANADLDKLNLAKKVSDGQRILVKKNKHISRSSSLNIDPDRVKVNLNFANKEQLISIPGIGPKTADLILIYRNELGYFTSLDQLLQIKGIGQKTLEKLKVYLNI